MTFDLEPRSKVIWTFPLNISKNTRDRVMICIVDIYETTYMYKLPFAGIKFDLEPRSKV